MTPLENLQIWLRTEGCDGIVVPSTDIFLSEFAPPSERPAVLQLRRGTSWSTAYETISLPEMDGFLAEIDSFADLISIGSPQWSGVTPEQSVDIARTLEAIIASARAHIPIDL